ncbi:hypothetical protein HDZ31DRAFT_66477 [Schizophyllum fasciatum]
MDSDMISGAGIEQSTGLKIRLPARKDWPSNQPRKMAGGSRVKRALQRTGSLSSQDQLEADRPRHEFPQSSSPFPPPNPSTAPSTPPRQTLLSSSHQTSPVRTGFGSPSASSTSSASSYDGFVASTTLCCGPNLGQPQLVPNPAVDDDAMDVDMD